MRDESPARPEDLVVFLGPTLAAREAAAIAPCRVLPPARQGDLWRCLSFRPRAIALVDGVFHQVPSVWHREILAAMQAGVAVFGASSMGALRASELWTLGMIGIGTIFGWYRDGVIVDDAEVALLHAGPELGHRPITVPLVNVRHAAAQARREGVLTAREARALAQGGAAIFYQDRTWPALLASSGLSRAARERFEAFAEGRMEDLKALDARACIEAAGRFVAAQAPPPPPSLLPATPSLARRRRLADSEARRGEDAIRGAQVLEELQRREGAGAVERGLSRALIAAWAREQGLLPAPEEVEAAERAWLSLHGADGAQGRAELLALCGLDESEAHRLFEDVALERLALSHAERMVSDGPSPLEALAAEARLRGAWARAARRLLPVRRRRAKRR
jgi:hypothetical protein